MNGSPRVIPCSTGEVAAAAGISFRRLDNWSTRGHLRPEGYGGGKPGWRRYWPDREIRVAVVMARLVDVGGFTVEGAARAARLAVDTWYSYSDPERRARVPLGDGLVLEVEP